MQTETTRGTVRASKPYVIYRIVIGLLFIGYGVYRYLTYGTFNYFLLIFGVIFASYGLVGLLFPKQIGSQIEMETSKVSAQDRLAELLKLRNDSLISPEEYEIKRQES